MKQSTKRRMISMTLSAALAGSALASFAFSAVPSSYYYPYGYTPYAYGSGYSSSYYDYRSTSPYGYGYYQPNKDGIISSYIVGGNLYGYYGSNVDSRSYLGGVNAPRYILSDVTLNNKASGVVLLGRSEQNGSNKNLLIDVSSGSRVDFGEVLGRAADKTLCLTINAVGTNVGDASMAYLGLIGRIDQFEKLYNEGLDSLAFVDKSANVRVTVSLSDLIDEATAAFKDKGISTKTGRLYLGVQPSDEKFNNMVGNSSYTIKAYAVGDAQNIEISSWLSDPHVIARSNQSTTSWLQARKNGENIKPSNRTFINEASGNFATGYLPWGSSFAVVQ